MRCSSAVSLAIVLSLLAFPPSAHAKIPDPELSEVVISGNSQGCQFRFAESGGGDVLTVGVQLQSAIMIPPAYNEVSVTLVPTSETVALCSCCPTEVHGWTDENGYFETSFSSIGGHGSLNVETHALSIGDILISVDRIVFTSQDLNGSCEPSNATNLFDLAVFASALSPSYDVCADYDCNDTVNVFDLGFFATGLGVGCGEAACP